VRESNHSRVQKKPLSESSFILKKCVDKEGQDSTMPSIAAGNQKYLEKAGLYNQPVNQQPLEGAAK